MKKILYICSFILITVSGFMYYYYAAFLDSRSWEYWGYSESSQEFFLTEDIKINESAVKEIVLRNADTYGINIVKTNYTSEQNTSILKKGIYINNTGNTDMKLTLKGGGDFWLTNLEEGQILSTKEGQPVVFDQFRDDNVEFMKLTYLWERCGTKGEYVAVPSNADTTESSGNIVKFIDSLCSELGVTREQLTTRTSFQAISVNSAIYIFSALFLLVLLFFALANILYTVKSSKMIGIQLLNGYSASCIWWELIKPILYYSVIMLFIIDLVISYLVKPYYIGFILYLLLIQTGVIGLICFCSLFSYGYIKRQRLNELIKGKKRVKNIAVLAKLVQIAFVSCGIIIIMAVANDVNRIFEYRNELIKWKPYESLKVLEKMSIGDDLASITGQSQNFDKDCAQLYEEVNELGAVYFSKNVLKTVSLKTKFNERANCYEYEDYVPEYLQKNPISLTVVNVNTNYLKNYPVYDSEGKQIHIDSDTSGNIILVPKETDYDLEAVKELIVASEKNESEFMKKRYGTDYIEKRNLDDIQVIYYTTPLNIFNMSLSENEESDNIIVNPVIKVLTNENISFNKKVNTKIVGLNSPVKLPDSIGEGQLNEIFLRDNLDDNKFSYVSIGSYFANKEYVLKQQISLLLMIYIVLFLLSVFITSQEAALSFESRKKMLSVMATFGYSYWDKHRMRIILDVIVIVISVVIGVIVLKPEFHTFNRIVIALFIVLNLMTQMIITKRNEKKVINTVIKGA